MSVPPSRGPSPSALRRWLAPLLAVMVSVTGVAVLPSAAQASLLAPLAVSLTFDDSTADQMPAAATLQQAGMAGTFYAVNDWLGHPGYQTRADLNTLAAQGHEIGGHTVTHQDLATLSPDELRRQVCNNRATLQSWGFSPVSFAYPFASSTPAVQAAVRDCGYNTARGLGDVASPKSLCLLCVRAESNKPANPMDLRAPDQVDSTWKLADLQRAVTRASVGGGWLVLTFHHVCAPTGTAACPADTSVTPTVFNAFVSWLKTFVRNPLNRTTVKTIDQQVRSYSGSGYPAYRTAQRAPAPPPAAVGANALSNASLETANPETGFPKCFMAGGYGNNQVAWAKAAPGHTGATAQGLTVSGYQDGDAKLLPTFDLGECAPSVVPGRSYDLSTWFTSTGLTQFALYYRNSEDHWVYWTSSPWVAPAAEWTQATYRTPPLPADATALSFGLAAIANGTVVTDDYSMVDPGAAQSRMVQPKSESLTRSEGIGTPSKPGRVFSHQRLLVPRNEGQPVQVLTGAGGKG